MKKAFRIYIRGAVQGLSFRQFVKDNAERLDVKGFVRNLEDGRVEVFAEGDQENVEKIIELCKKGPRHARVDNIEIKEEKIQEFKEFKVLHI